MLTDVFIKFSQAFITSNQEALTIIKIHTDKWFYFYGFSAQIHSDKGHSFENDIISPLNSMYNIKQSMTTAYSHYGTFLCEGFNCILLDLIKNKR